MPRTSKHSKAHPRRSVGGEKRTMNMRSSFRLSTINNLIPNDTAKAPFNQTDGRQARQQALSEFQSGLKPIRQSKNVRHGDAIDPKYGAELVSNHHFTSDLSDWTHDAGWFWFGLAIGTSAPDGSDLYQDIATQAGKNYLIEVHIIAGSEHLEVYFGDKQIVWDTAQSKTFTHEVQSVEGSSTTVRLRLPEGGDTVTLHHVSVREIIDRNVDWESRASAPGLVGELLFDDAAYSGLLGVI